MWHEKQTHKAGHFNLVHRTTRTNKHANTENENLARGRNQMPVITTLWLKPSTCLEVIVTEPQGEE